MWEGGVIAPLVSEPDTLLYRGQICYSAALSVGKEIPLLLECEPSCRGIARGRGGRAEGSGEKDVANLAAK